jgi:hypothetical protein
MARGAAAQEGASVLSLRDLFRHRRRGVPLPVQDETDAGAALTARVKPKSVLVEEAYRVRQEISRNGDFSVEPDAIGKIELEVPYDGHEHVTRAALDDIQHWAVRNAASPPGAVAEQTVGVVEAQIGHLVLSDHQDTDLAAVTGLTSRTMAIPLTVPVRSDDLRSNESLTTDRYTFRQEIRYQVANRSRLVPVTLDVEVTDPGSTSVPEINLGLDEAIVMSQEYMTFASYLELRVRVDIALPGRKGWVPRAPVVRRVSLSLPSGLTLALSSVEVELADDGCGASGEGSQPLIQQNPDDAAIEWHDVTTHGAEGQKPDPPFIFHSPLMRVRIHQPGELFREPELVVRARVETDDVLLSGAQVRLFDARGRRLRGTKGPLTVRSSITADATVVLDDAFARRTFHPQLSFHFDEVIPGNPRVQDIQSALMDLRFDVEQVPLPGKTRISKSQSLIAYLVARRGTDEDAIRLHLFVLGRQHRTQRQSRHPGGRRYTSKLDTGDLTLVVFGEAPRDSSPLVHEVNALQMGLRDRFRRMKAQR